MKKNLIFGAIFGLLLAQTNLIQAQSGGAFEIEQSVVADGSGHSTGGVFSVNGTIGQTSAGTRSTGAPFDLQSGFWTNNALIPTAATVSISGRLLAADSIGVRNARVVLTNSNGGTQTATSGTFGYFQFVNITAGETVVISVVSKRFQFQPQVISVSEDVENLTLTAIAP